MKIADNTSEDVKQRRGGLRPPSIRLAPDALPEVQEPVLAANSHTGVSIRNAHTASLTTAANQPKEVPHWYALRSTYSREKKAFEYLSSKGIEVFYPTITTEKIIEGKRKIIEKSRIPNILFAYGTETLIKSFVFDNVNLPYLRFYYRHISSNYKIIKEPLIVPDNQMESLKIICAAESKDILFDKCNLEKFKMGQLVRVIEGDFKGVIGRVARFQGQQRLGVNIDGVMTAITAYVPSAFLERID